MAAARSSGSSVVRRRLGTALRALREDRNIRIEAAARELECSAAKVSRLENGQGPAKRLEVRALLDFYGVADPATRARFETWADGTKSAGWWESDADVVEDDVARYFAVETESVLIRIYCTPVLPTILQSPEYNLAHVRELYPDMTVDESHRFAEVRRSRRDDLLDPDNPLRLVAVVEEGAIRRQVGSPQIHAAGLLWLADLLDELADAGRDDIDFRVFPFGAGTPERAVCSFTLLTPRDLTLDPVTMYVEEPTGSYLYDSAEDVTAMTGIFDRLLDRCLSPATSRAMLRAVVTTDGDPSLRRQP